ncbi:MAG: Shedu immune nuclease family protein [Verrucomicrobiota bacterium]|jgi:hypothetical protein
MRPFPRPHPGIEFENRSDYETFTLKQKRRRVDSCDPAFGKLKKLVQQKVKEAEIQVFFEEYPYLLPGIGILHHGPFEGVVATKFQLGNAYETDFAFIASTSQTLHISCVEIESPRKLLFQKNGAFSRDYLDAKQQITDWLFWAHHNVRQALDCWGYLLKDIKPHFYTIEFRAYLVFGRRADIDDPKKRERWAAESLSLKNGLSTMTYDRLIEQSDFREHGIDNGNLVVCSYRDRRFRVKKLCPCN